MRIINDDRPNNKVSTGGEIISCALNTAALLIAAAYHRLYYYHATWTLNIFKASLPKCRTDIIMVISKSVQKDTVTGAKNKT